jgi:hypothetical protein
MGRKSKPKVKGKNQGKSMTDTDREVIRQTYLVLQNKAEVARQLGWSLGSIDKALKIQKAEDPQVKEARVKSAKAIAGKIHHKVNMILDSITPEDLISGYDEVADQHGNIRHILYGPSLMQKVTAGAIMTDKLKVVRDYELALDDDRASGYLPLPGTLSGLITGIRGKIKQLSALNIQFEHDNPDLSQKIQDTLTQAVVLEEISPENAEVLDFDNPGKNIDDSN